jgi:hypothetical protein
MCLEVGFGIVAYQTVVYPKEEYRHCAGPGEAKREARTCRNRDRGKEGEVIALARASPLRADWVGEETGRASVCNDADSKRCLSYRVGDVRGIGQRSSRWTVRPKSKAVGRVTTDGHTAYLEAVETTFGADCDYAVSQEIYGGIG